MPSGDVSVTASYSGVSADIVVSHFRAIFKILHDDNPLATSFGRSLTEPSDDVDEYFEIKNVKMWYDSDSRKICWHSDDGTMKFQPGSLAGLFKDCSAFTAISLEGMDTSDITDMSFMFCGCYALTGITFGSSFDTSSVTDMSYMFSTGEYNVTGRAPRKMNFQSLDVSGFDTSNVTNMSHMFYQCSNSSFTELDVSGFRTANVTDMSYMFACYMNQPFYVSELDLSGWDFTNVTTVANMFDRCEYLDDGLTFPTTTNFAKLTTMYYMFSQCRSLSPETLGSIVGTWTFANHTDSNGTPDYPDAIYANNTTSLFGRYGENSTNAPNYLIRDTMLSGGTYKNFKDPQHYVTGDGHDLYIGGTKTTANCYLTVKPGTRN